MNSRIKQIILFIIGVVIIIALLFIFLYAFIFLVIIGLIYYIYRKIFKRPKKVNIVNDDNKKINPVIIDMED